MNEAPMKQRDAAEQDAIIETPPEELPEPHFDDLAILIAQPVEPIAQGKNWLAWLEKPQMIIATLVVAALLGATAVALTLQLSRQRTLDPAVADNKANESEPKTVESKAQAESPLGALADQLKSRAPRRRSRAVDSGETKPVARRVGVIVYGRGSEQP